MSKYQNMALPEEAAKMVVLDPYTGDPMLRPDGTECWIELYPSMSKRGQQIDRQQTDRMIQSQKRRFGGREAEGNALEKLALLTKDWSLVAPDGTAITDEASPDNCVAMYTDAPWLRDQVGAFVSNLGNFRPSPSPTSSPMPNENSN